jgi:AbrB family looped-hinge helix DNA binding protein
MAMGDVSTKIAAGGRIVIPADFRRELGADVGDEIILRIVEGEIHILTRSQAVRKAQALVRKSIPAGRSLVKELLQERRKDAKRE